MEFEQKFLINENFAEIASHSLLHAKSTKRLEFLTAASKADTGEIPLVTTTGIVPGFRYPSSTKGGHDFFLPKYVLRAVDGRFVTRLEMFAPNDDPAAPAGQLTIEVQTIPLPESKRPPRVVDHDLRMRLGYHIPIDDADTETVAPGIKDFAGLWTNSDPDTDGTLSLNISPAGGSRLTVHAIQACQPKPCDLGTVLSEVIDGTAVALFRGKERTTSLTLKRDENRLTVSELLDIHDPENPGDFRARHSFNRLKRGQEPSLIWFDLAPAAIVSGTVRRSVTTISDSETYLKIYRVLTAGQHLARIELRATATVGRRSIKQVFVGHKDREALLKATKKQSFKIEKADVTKIRTEATEKLLQHPDALSNARIELLIKKPVPEIIDKPAARLEPTTRLEPTSRLEPATRVTPVTRAEPATRPISGVRLNPTLAAGTLGALRMPVADLVVQPSPVRSGGPVPITGLSDHTVTAMRLAAARNEAELIRVNTLALDGARTSPNLSLNLDRLVIANLDLSKLPRWVLVEENGEPVLTRREADCVQTISPMWVDPDLYADQIDPPNEVEGELVLLRQELTSGGQSATFFQDALAPAQIYYEPQEFRLVRSDSAPFAPMMLFHLNEVVDETSDETDEPVFSVTMTYQAKPFIHTDLIAAARLHYGADVSIASIVPSVSSLTIRLPSSSAGTENEITRDDVEIDFSDGISDMITFSETEFHQLTTAFQTVSGIGLDGHVDVTFLDGRTGQIPLRIGLRDTIGHVFSSSIQTGNDSADFSYQLRNRIESPAQIDSFPAITLSDNRRAVPIGDPPDDLISPDQTVSVAYRSEPPGGSGPDTLAVDEVTVEPDMLAILSQTTVVQGYSENSFTITVSIDPMFFEFVPEGVEAITSVDVSFRTRAEPVILTAMQPSQVVTLQMPKLLFLSNADAAQHYSYSVQDTHASGPGMATAFRAGSGNLDVQPALAEVADS